MVDVPEVHSEKEEIKPAAWGSRPRSTSEAPMASWILWALGLAINAPMPIVMAMVMKWALSNSLAGRPKEILESPITEVKPQVSRQ